VIDGTRYYAPDYWAPERYHAWQERQWRQQLGGNVEVGDVKDISRESGETKPVPALPEGERRRR